MMATTRSDCTWYSIDDVLTKLFNVTSSAAGSLAITIFPTWLGVGIHAEVTLDEYTQ